MSRLSKNFTRNEFKCKCGCGSDTVDCELIIVLEVIRTHFNKRVYILSGNRCVSYNSKVGGVKLSQHIIGKAADIKVEDTIPEDVYNFAHASWPFKYGLGNGKTFTHIDVRKGPARWNYS